MLALYSDCCRVGDRECANQTLEISSTVTGSFDELAALLETLRLKGE